MKITALVPIACSYFFGREVPMLKIRLQGTKSEISWFKRFLKKAEELEVTEFSQPYKNQGTDRYYRVYAEVEKAKEQK